MMKRIHLHSLDAVDPFDSKTTDNQPQRHGDFTGSAFWKNEFLWPNSNTELPPRLPVPKKGDPMPETKL